MESQNNSHQVTMENIKETIRKNVEELEEIEEMVARKFERMKTLRYQSSSYEVEDRYERECEKLHIERTHEDFDAAEKYWADRKRALKIRSSKIKIQEMKRIKAEWRRVRGRYEVQRKIEDNRMERRKDIILKKRKQKMHSMLKTRQIGSVLKFAAWRREWINYWEEAIRKM